MVVLDLVVEATQRDIAAGGTVMDPEVVSQLLARMRVTSRCAS
jgi:hypothetical protein